MRKQHVQAITAQHKTRIVHARNDGKLCSASRRRRAKRDGGLHVPVRTSSIFCDATLLSKPSKGMISISSKGRSDCGKQTCAGSPKSPASRPLSLRWLLGS